MCGILYYHNYAIYARDNIGGYLRLCSRSGSHTQLHMWFKSVKQLEDHPKQLPF